jgi:hypothetical protein
VNADRAGALVRYDLLGVADPELVPRVFGQLARRGIIPAAAWVQQADGEISIRIDLEDLDEGAAVLLGETLRALFLVHRISWRSL